MHPDARAGAAAKGDHVSGELLAGGGLGVVEPARRVVGCVGGKDGGVVGDGVVVHGDDGPGGDGPVFVGDGDVGACAGEALGGTVGETESWGCCWSVVTFLFC